MCLVPCRISYMFSLFASKPRTIKITVKFFSDKDARLLKNALKTLSAEYSDHFIFTDNLTEADVLLVDIDTAEGQARYYYRSLPSFQTILVLPYSEHAVHYAPFVLGKTYLSKNLSLELVDTLLVYLSNNLKKLDAAIWHNVLAA